MCTSEKSDLSREILAYLSEHPDAGDTLEGIVEWWLLEQQIKCRTAHVREAVDELVARGLLVERKTEGLPAYFRLRRGGAKKTAGTTRTGKTGHTRRKRGGE